MVLSEMLPLPLPVQSPQVICVLYERLLRLMVKVGATYEYSTLALGPPSFVRVQHEDKQSWEVGMRLVQILSLSHWSPSDLLKC